MSIQPTEEILPWKNNELEAILRELIAHGTEAAKVDFKSEIEAGTPEQKAELLKDITAIANTYDQNYGDHGFLIYGVEGKTIVGIVKTESTTDKLQNTIEQLLKTYIAVMPQIYVIGFETDDGHKWGTIVIPPRNSKPHMFFKDLQCKDPRHTRRRGEWFVRRGSTTDAGLPEDLALIMQRQTQLLTEPLKESLRNLQARIAHIEEQYNSALFKLVEKVMSSAAVATPAESQGVGIDASRDAGQATGTDLPTRLRLRLRTSTDALADGLASEAKALQEYLEGANTNVPWIPQLHDAEANRKIIEDLEEKTLTLQLSAAIIALNDKTGTYTAALVHAVKILAKEVDGPIGVQHNGIGIALRYYPLGIILHTIAICGVAAGRGNVIHDIFGIPLIHRRRNRVTSPIGDIFYLWRGSKSFFNHAFSQRSCEPISQRIRQLISDRILELVPDMTEPEFYFPGEFVLALAGIDMSMTKGYEPAVPLPGLYLYLSDAEGPITDLLRDPPQWLDRIYEHPMGEMLNRFDQNANKAIAPGCISLGFEGLKTAAIYTESLKRQSKKVS